MSVKIVQPPAPEPPEEESPDGFNDFDEDVEVEESQPNKESTEDSDTGEGSQE